MFSSLDSKYYEILIRIACKYLTGKMIYDIFVVQYDEVKSNISSKVNFQEILNDLEEKKEIYKFGIIAYVLKRTDLFDYLTDYEKKEALVAINTKESKKLLLETTADEKDLINSISKLEIEDDNFAEDVCIKAIAENGNTKEKAIETLVNKGNSKPLSFEKIIDLAIKMRGQDFNTIKKLIKYCTNYEYGLKKIKNNAQKQNKKDYLKLIKEMNENNLSVDEIIYLYMNTKLRTEIFIDQLIYEMINIGYRKSEIIDNLRKYRILGEIRHVNNDVVTVVTESVISSRLMIFRKSENIMIGSKCKVNPSTGKLIYFNIQNYLNTGLMYIDNIYEL